MKTGPAAATTSNKSLSQNNLRNRGSPYFFFRAFRFFTGGKETMR